MLDHPRIAIGPRPVAIGELVPWGNTKREASTTDREAVRVPGRRRRDRRSRGQSEGAGECQAGRTPQGGGRARWCVAPAP
jgi:hypothetical protein